MNKVRAPRDPGSQWPPRLRFPDKEICSPGPYSSQRGLFPLLLFPLPTHPSNTRIYIGLLRGDRLLALLSPRSEGEERERARERAGCHCWGSGTSTILDPLRNWGSRRSPFSIASLLSSILCRRPLSPPPDGRKPVRPTSVWGVKRGRTGGLRLERGPYFGARGAERGAFLCSRMGRGRE